MKDFLPSEPVKFEAYCDVCRDETMQEFLVIRYDPKQHVIHYRHSCLKCGSKIKAIAVASFWAGQIARSNRFREN